VDRVDLLEPVPCDKGSLAERTADGWFIDGEREWLVAGEPARLAAVLDALPTEVAQLWGPVVRLKFRNNVGRVPAGPLGMLHVRTGKWDEGRYDEMLASVVEAAQALPFDASTATGLPYVREADFENELPYHAFIWLAHALLEAPFRPLLGALTSIVADPHRRFVRVEHEVPVELARSIGPGVIDDILAMRWPLQRARAGEGVGGFMPLRVADIRNQNSADTAENRFVKAFLDACVHLVSRIRARIGGLSSEGTKRRVTGKLDAVEVALTPIRRARVWNEVGRMSHVASGSSVMQRDTRYREVLRASGLLRGASRALPLSDAQVVKLLEVKDIALLYELWCWYVVLGIVGDKIGTPSMTTPLRADELKLSLAWGALASWPNGVELAYNPYYTPLAGWHGRSRSVELRPDIVLRIPHGPNAGLHVFDAKFKRVRDSEEAVVADIHKMHAYRDAIPEVRSAWVVFPGSEPRCHLDSPSDKARGVGAFPVLPGGSHTELRRQISEILAGSL